MSVTDLDLKRIEQKLDAVLKLLHERGWDESPAGQHALSLEGAAKALGIGLTTVKKLLREGQLQTVMIAGRRLVPRSEINRLLTPVENTKPLRKKKEPVDWKMQGDEIRRRAKSKR